MSGHLCGRERLHLGQPLAQGGAGKFYPHPNRKRIGIKIYDHLQEVEQQRIEWLCSHPPAVLREKGTPTYAWPLKPVYDEATGDMAGFSMERVYGSLPIQAIINPNARSSAINRRWLWKVCESLLKRIQTLHLMPTIHVVGDINLENFLVSRDGIVTQIDLDSTHFSIPGGSTFTTLRCRPELQPPELISAGLPVLDRGQDQDAFSVSILIHRLLREGLHSHDSNFVGSGTPLRLHERIKAGIWPDSLRHPEYRPKDGPVPFDSLPQTLQDLFRQMFLDGHADRTKRPNVTDLLNCLQMHRPPGAKRARIGRLSWHRELYPHSTSPISRRIAATVKTHKKRITIASIALLGAGTALQTLPKSLTDSFSQSPLTIGSPREPESVPFVTPLRPRKDGSSMPTPRLWRQANDDAF